MTSIISTASWQPFGLFCHIFLSSRIRILRNKSDIGHKALQDFFFFIFRLQKELTYLTNAFYVYFYID